MVSRTTPRFWRAYDGLPAEVQRQARAAYRLFRADPRHPSLRLKQVHPTAPVVSVRVGARHRALGRREAGDAVVWFWIGTHAEYDRLVAAR